MLEQARGGRCADDRMIFLQTHEDKVDELFYRLLREWGSRLFYEWSGGAAFLRLLVGPGSHLRVLDASYSST